MSNESCCLLVTSQQIASSKYFKPQSTLTFGINLRQTILIYIRALIPLSELLRGEGKMESSLHTPITNEDGPTCRGLSQETLALNSFFCILLALRYYEVVFITYCFCL